MRKSLWVLVVWVGAVGARGGETNVFAPYLNDEAPTIVETLSKGIEEGVEVTRFKYLSRVVPESGRKVIIYSVMARPTTQGPHPAVLVCHGGGGYADMVASMVVGWAKRGFVSICQDQPGFCNRSKGSSTGPFMDKGASSFRIEDKPQDSALFDGIAAALNGLRFLRSQPDVDKSRVGVFGGSWGGYMTTVVTGISGKRVRAAFSVYGCGYFDVASTWMHRLDSLGPAKKAIWLEHLDAGRRAKNLSAAYFVPSPANDWYFWPPAVMRTLADMQGERNYCFMANDSHSLREPGGMSGPPKVDHRRNRTYMEIVWLEYWLQGKGKPFPRCKATGEPKREGNAARVAFEVDGPLPITRATVWHAAGELPWRMKWWAPAPATLKDGRYTALVPVEEPDQPIHWFAVVTDERNVSVSTLVRTLEPKAIGFKAEGYPVARFRQDFEDRVEHRRWRMKYADRRPGRHRVRPEAARTGKYGLLIQPGKSTVCCFGLRAATLKRSGAKAIRFWARAVDKPCPLPVVDVQAEIADSRRTQWRWAKAPKTLVGTQWQAIDVPLAELEFVGKGEPPVPMLSPCLGQLRFTTTPETHLYLDDVVAQ